jgi:hypothetical protein
MSQETLQDQNYRTIGYVETMSDGRKRLMDSNYRTLGYYDPRRNITEDANYRVVGHGDVLTTLLKR